MKRDHIARVGATGIVLLAAIGALLVDGDVEVTLLMVAAVIAGLVCFDSSMERRLQAFGPWVLLSLAPATKTIPTVWYELRSGSGVLFERYDHAGSLLFGVCVFAAVVLLSRPAPRLGAAVWRFDVAVIAGTAVTGAVAGASVAFLFDGGFGSASAGRLLETPTWFVLAGIMAATAIAASRSQRLPVALAGVLMTAAASAGLLALSVAGADIDRGWWALVFAGLAASGATHASLGEPEGRDRVSNVSVLVALLVGLIAAASAIAARSDRTAWGPGWVLLGLLSLAMFGLALASKPLDAERERVNNDADHAGSTDHERARRARTRALQTLDREPGPLPRVTPAGLTTPAAEQGTLRSTASAFAIAVQTESAPAPADPQLEPAVGPPSSSSSPASHPSRAEVPRVRSKTPATPSVESPPAVPRIAEDPPEAPPEPTMQPVTDVAASTPQWRETAPSASEPAAAPASQPPADPAEPQAAPLSDAGLVSSARDAAAVRTAPQSQRHSLAPLAQAHHFDPSTGLLSAAGLQHAIARAFDVPRRAGHVTILMFSIRDLDRIEGDHGRLASAAVTREVADRVANLLPDGTGARFARSAYAVVFVGDYSDTHETTQRLARVLLQLRAPVEGGSLGDKIDVVAGMAQCYEGEDAAHFVQRANLGLARAVQLPEPTLVAMP